MPVPKNPFLLRHSSALGLIVVTCITIAAASLFYRQGHSLYEARRWLVHTYEVEQNIQYLFNAVQDAQLGERGYLLTGNRIYLQPYRRAIGAEALPPGRHSVPEELKVLRRLTVDNPRQQKRLDAIEPITRDLLDYLAATIAVRAREGPAAAMEREVRVHYGKVRMDRLRALIEQMTAEENRLIAERAEIDDASLRANGQISLLALSIFYLALACAAWLVTRLQAHLYQCAQQVDAANRRLEIQYERSQEQSLARLSAVVDNALDGVVTTDEQGRILSLNPAAERMFRVAAADVRGRPITELVADYNIPVATSATPAVGVRQSLTGKRSDGSSFALESAVSSFEIDGQLHFCGILRDVSERRQAEEVRGLLSAIVESSGDAIVSKNLNGIITSWNDAAERLFGYTAAEAIGQSITMIIPEERLDEERHILSQIRQGRSIEHFETVRLAKDGSFLDISVTISPVRGADGVIIGASKTARDIRERRQSEAERQRLVERLTHSNEELGRFAYIASHDLKEPLRMVTSFTGLLEKKYSADLDDKARQYIAFAREGAERMQRLVDDLLEYARVDTADERVEVVDCTQVLEMVKANLALQIEESGARIGARDLPVLRANAVRMTMLLQNLLSNAIKYQSAGATPEIEIWGEDRGESWQIAVRDNGIGIRAEYLTRIFEPFKRLHTKDQYRGTGIGLAISQKIVENWGGKIWAESEFGHTTTFFVLIPKRL